MLYTTNPGKLLSDCQLNAWHESDMILQYSDKVDEYFHFCYWRKIRETFVLLKILDEWIR